MKTLARHQWIRAGWLLMGLLFTGAVSAQAHKVTVFAWVEGQTIHTESKFSHGKPVKAGAIEVFDAHGRKLLDGVTDDKGRFAFPVPQKSDLQIVLKAGMGHANQWVIRADEFGTASAGQSAVVPLPAPAESIGTQPVSAAQPWNDKCLDAAAVQQIIEQVMEQKLAPLTTRLAEHPWQWRDILAGIGYILGLMGVASYVHYRKQKP